MKPRIQKLSAMLSAAGVLPSRPPGSDPEILGACLDSRRVEPGDLFFALRGFESDGEAFVPQAVRRGARAVVAASPRPADLDPAVAWVEVAQPRRVAGLLSREIFGRPDEALTLVGITGTNGKTTVAYMVQAIAQHAGKRAGRIGTTGFAYADIEQELPRTTPEAPDLYRLLERMRSDSVELVAMEVSSHSLALSRVEGARFATAAFLNLGRDHMDFHRDAEDYFKAKARLFADLGPEQHAVLPADTEYGRRLRGDTRGRVITFGRSETADVRMRDERSGIDGSSVVLETPLGSFPVRSFLFGHFNLENIAAATACAIGLGFPVEAVTAGILSLERVPGRVERVDRGQPFTILVDYAHTPEALLNVLQGARAATDGRLSVVFGCGGDRDREKRGEMGRAAAEAADLAFITSDNPRNEDPLEIIEAVARGAGGGTAECLSIVDRGEAIEAALKRAAAGDVVIIAGKGHETTQSIGGRARPFDDREVAAAVLARMGYGGSGA